MHIRAAKYSAVPLRLLYETAAFKRTYGAFPQIRRPVTWAGRPCITEERCLVHAGCSQVRVHCSWLPFCIKPTALWERVLQRIMSCSLHLLNDCNYFSPIFIICQYIFSKLGRTAISDVKKRKALGDFVSIHKAEGEKTLDFHTLKC